MTSPVAVRARRRAGAQAVYDGTDVDAGRSFTTGLDRILDAVAVKLTRSPA
jgi:hypothetical protein